MLDTREQIRNAALNLAPGEREMLAEELLRSVSPVECAAIDDAWRIELRQRDNAYRHGAMATKSLDDVLAKYPRRTGT